MRIKCRDKSEWNALKRLLLRQGVPRSSVTDASGMFGGFALEVSDNYLREAAKAKNELNSLVDDEGDVDGGEQTSE